MGAVKYIFFLLVSLLFSGCFDKGPEIVNMKEQYFVFNSFPPRQVAIPEKGGELLPWTSQVRVSDYAVADGVLYMGVNSSGILKLTINEPCLTSFDFVENSSIFSGRTLKKLFLADGRLYCHLYRDTFFSELSSDELMPPLIWMNLGDNNFKYDFMKEKDLSEWEVVDLYSSSGMWFSAWKYSDADLCSFRYFTHDISGNNMAEIDENTFQTGIPIIGLDNETGSDNPLRRIYSFTDRNSIVDIVVKEEDISPDKVYRFYPEGEDPDGYKEIPVYRQSGEYYFICNNKILCLESDNIFNYRLSPLPSGYTYTGICSSERYLFLFWEYKSFFKTGKAGFSIIDKKRVDKITL